MIRILIAEDQGMVLGALAALLNLEDDLEVVFTAANGQIAFQHLQQHHADIDIVITDIEMPEMTGIELAQNIQTLGIHTRTVILTTFARAGFLKRAMNAGVRGYLVKDAPSSELAAAVRKVAAGGKAIAAELLTESWAEDDPLSNKERRALQLVKEGFSTEDIAKKLHLSTGTVRNYLSFAVSKLHARNSVDAARIAHQKGWL